MRNTFRKSERLTSKKVISEVFSTGKSFRQFPLKIFWKEVSSEQKFPVQVLFSVPKKNFKSAVLRNKLKRQMREAYRKNKHILYDVLKKSNKQIAIVIICNSDSTGKEIESKIILSLHRLAQENETI